MPDSNSPYMTLGAQPLLEMLKGQLISATEDRRRVMLWSAILALGLLMLLGQVASVPWFLALVPLVLLAVWNACLLVRQRRFQAVWDGLMEKAGDSKSSATTKAAAAAVSARELGARDIPAVLSALVAPSVMVFHGLLLGAVVTGGVVHEVDHDSGSNSHIAKGKSESSGSACGCGGGGGGANVAVKSPPQVTRPSPSNSPRSFSNAPARPSQAPPNVAYPTRPAPMNQPGQTRVLPQPVPPNSIPQPQLPPTGAPAAPSASPAAPGAVPAAPAVGPTPAPPIQAPAPVPAAPISAPPPTIQPATPAIVPQVPTTSARPN